MPKLIDICGCIATGKTTLAKLLARDYGYTYLQESLQDNPYLDRFIDDPRTWGIHNQLFFLTKLLTDEMIIRRAEGNKYIVRDYSIEDRYLYAHSFHMCGLMSEDNYVNYVAFLNWLKKHVKQPDLIIFLDAPFSVLQQRLQERPWRHPIIMGMLTSLHDNFLKWANSMDAETVPLLRIDSTVTDFYDPLQLKQLVEKIRSLL